ncbi:oxygen-independent coproporphyrinogen III oxidase [Rhizobium sp. CRIBSB]|nr:oxygen-independent coproporphyrinogen III oxidase [Rhizobium sp. CRIBSB]
MSTPLSDLRSPVQPGPLTGPRSLPAIWRDHAGRNLPRYTSYPTAAGFQPVADDRIAHEWLGQVQPSQTLSAYVHVPFCRRLCWYCGCHTTVVHDYERVGAFNAVLGDEIDLWQRATPAHAGLAHLHFGGGSPNALDPEAFIALVHRLSAAFGLRPGSEVAAELDPGQLSDAFIDAAGRAGVTRASLGVQTFDPDVQRRVNRVQPFDQVAAVTARLRSAGIGAVNFDMMYGLPGQTADSVADSMRACLSLDPDRVAVFGYAHVPWMKRHQVMIRDADLPDIEARWAQAEAADEVLLSAGYVRLGLDHYARPGDPLADAAASGRLRRNFQGYTDDPAPVLIPIGPSSIGRLAGGFVQNAPATDVWSRAIRDGRLPTARALGLTPDDALRAEVIERLMCDLGVDVGAICVRHGFGVAWLDEAIGAARSLEGDGLCRVTGRQVTVSPDAHRMMRVVASCFDAHLPGNAARHAKAV